MYGDRLYHCSESSAHDSEEILSAVYLISILEISAIVHDHVELTLLFSWNLYGVCMLCTPGSSCFPGFYVSVPLTDENDNDDASSHKDWCKIQFLFVKKESDGAFLYVFLTKCFWPVNL